MSEALFFRVLHDEDKAEALLQTIKEIQHETPQENGSSRVFPVDPDSFAMVPGAPFAYWASGPLRALFTALPPLESDGRVARVGLQTSDDFRFVRAWWEVAPGQIVTGGSNTPASVFRQQTCEGRNWVPFAKGGEYSPYYADLHLVINWAGDGDVIKSWAGSLYNHSHWSRIIKNTDYYFRAGVTWPLRGIRLSAQAVPTGTIFSVAGKLATSTDTTEIPELLALMNSGTFDYLVRVLAGKVGGAQYEAGLIGRVPVPHDLVGQQAASSALEAVCAWF